MVYLSIQASLHEGIFAYLYEGLKDRAEKEDLLHRVILSLDLIPITSADYQSSFHLSHLLSLIDQINYSHLYLCRSFVTLQGHHFENLINVMPILNGQ